MTMMDACVVRWCGVEHRHEAYFVDLFVRVSNLVAVGMYRKFGYVVYRQVLGYYSGEEDAYGTDDDDDDEAPTRLPHSQ